MRSRRGSRRFLKLVYVSGVLCGCWGRSFLESEKMSRRCSSFWHITYHAPTYESGLVVENSHLGIF